MTFSSSHPFFIFLFVLLLSHDEPLPFCRITRATHRGWGRVLLRFVGTLREPRPLPGPGRRLRSFPPRDCWLIGGDTQPQSSQL